MDTNTTIENNENESELIARIEAINDYIAMLEQKMLTVIQEIENI
jgi:hypothetical protein